MRFAHLAQRLFNTPLAIKADKAEIIMTALAERLGVTHLSGLDGRGLNLEAEDGLPEEGWRARAPDRQDGYDLVQGIAIIQVHGTLVKKLGTLRPYSGMTGFDGIRQNFLMALTDPNVKAIMLDIDSPGGEVAGCFDLADTIYEARGEKPIWAILDEGAYSAAYAIASAADHITVPRTGGVGSIGVIWMHVDWSKALTEAGLKVTFVTFGAHKADGHPEIPLSSEAKNAIQSEIDAVGELFVATVARNRNLAASAVRETEAMTYLAEHGVSAGLADAVMAPDAAFRALLEKLA